MAENKVLDTAEATEYLTERQIMYLYIIYQLYRSKNQILSADIARKLHVSKPTVISMLEIFEKKDLITKKYYGKVQLTETGIRLASQLDTYMAELITVVPRMGLSLKREEVQACAWELFCALPDSVLNKLVEHG